MMDVLYCFYQTKAVNTYVIQNKFLSADIIYKLYEQAYIQGIKSIGAFLGKNFCRRYFPAIDEEPFSVLYSSNASRPNTPVNICIGALIIKEIFGISDDELVENLMLDPRYQYVLHTTSCEEQPMSDKFLSRFRKRCYDYEFVYGIDLLHNCITGLSDRIARLVDINLRIKRMDSVMIAVNIRKLSSIELLYTCVSKHYLLFYSSPNTSIWQLFITSKADLCFSGVTPAQQLASTEIVASGYFAFKINAFEITQISVHTPINSISSMPPKSFQFSQPKVGLFIYSQSPTSSPGTISHPFVP